MWTGLRSGDEFASLVYSDPDLLTAEFDEIVAAEWPAAANVGRRTRCRVDQPDGRTPRVPVLAGTTGAHRETPRTHECQGRQRSPPLT